MQTKGKILETKFTHPPIFVIRYSVVAKGRYYDRQMLDAMLHQAHEKKMKLDEERQ